MPMQPRPTADTTRPLVPSSRRSITSLSPRQGSPYRVTTALGMAAAGLGVAILPEAAITSAPATVCRVDIRNPVLTRRIGIITMAVRTLPPAAQKLVEALRRLSTS
ncbi:MAG: hypothetical protein DMF95_33060 [Acidobacteria bacterium]|nr:MAG: hypothetical protein DMF95_33060 [Acidobacteriota bacterium]